VDEVLWVVDYLKAIWKIENKEISDFYVVVDILLVCIVAMLCMVISDIIDYSYIISINSQLSNLYL
jgi:hypothetical protein